MGVRFTRASRFRPGKEAEAWDVSNRVAAHIREQYGVEISWGYQWGGLTGVIYFYVDYDSMGHWEELSMSMFSDETLQSMMAEGQNIFVDGGTDTIVRLE